MKNNAKLTPQLCFSHIITKWDEAKVQDIFIFLSTNTYSRNQLNYEYGKYQNIHYGDILVKYNSIIDAQKEEIPYINEDIECTSNNIVMNGDIIIADTAEDEIVGKTSEIQNVGDKKILSGLHTFWLRPQILFAPKYLGYFFNSTQYHNQLLPLIQGAKVSSISKKALINTIIVYPSPIEQQKIADCLSSLDNLIEATNRKIEALKEHKKGLMQRLFPKGGGNVPELRFPEFQGTKGWEEKKLTSLCDITNGKCNAQDHIEGGKYPLFDRSAVVKYSNNYLYDCEAVIIPGEGVRFIPKYYNGKFNLHQRAYALKDFSCNGKFLFYDMEYHSGLLAVKAVKSTVLSLRLPILQNFPLHIPFEDVEQQKIADCLSSLDELIEATSQKVEVLKEHKKGLMQQLFPKI